MQDSIRLDLPETDPLLCARDEKDVVESQNAILQFDEARRIARTQLGRLALTPPLICHLHRFAIGGLYRCAGNFRKGDVEIQNASHLPPSWLQIDSMVEEMCGYANQASREIQNSIHCAAYVMWRMNWIHPFFGGNGRTSRVVSYIALCGSLGLDPPGRVTIPELIQEREARRGYFEALTLADKAWSLGKLDVSAMELLVESLFIRQLRSA